MAKLLLVDDDEILVESLKHWLTAENHRVDCTHDGLQALEYLKSYEYDMIILDWQLPGMEGIDICRNYRAAGGKSFIIMLTGQGDSIHKEMGLDTGADDYIPKPFDIKELLARIRARLRRPSELHGDILQVGTISCDVKARRVKLNGSELKLSPLEYNVLEFFLRHPDEIFSSENLLRSVWTADDEVAIDAVYTCLTRLRKKLQQGDGAEMIQNVHGVGYKFVPHLGK